MDDLGHTLSHDEALLVLVTLVTEAVPGARIALPVAASGVAMLFQALSARLGIATGRNLAELCRDAVPRPVAWLLWGIIEIAMMATDVAEFLGATVALNLLFGLPLLTARVGIMNSAGWWASSFISASVPLYFRANHLWRWPR